jgi:hypothetical protein
MHICPLYNKNTIDTSTHTPSHTHNDKLTLDTPLAYARRTAHLEAQNSLLHQVVRLLHGLDPEVL